MKLGILGSGAMGSGIAQVAATAGWEVVLYDNDPSMPAKSLQQIGSALDRLVEKGRLMAEDAGRFKKSTTPVSGLTEFRDCDLVIEAIVENFGIKKQVFHALEAVVSPQCILATNTSSLSVTAIAGAIKSPERVIGIHFFNPAPVMALVEIIPAVQTSPEVVKIAREWINGWGKQTVLAKDTPGFIVNRIARPFYGEAIRLLEEGFADVATIDWAMKAIGGFRMGPFELMDMIGNDVNYAVTESVFQAFYYDPRYRPSFTQRRLVEAGWLGRKSGKGHYDYAENGVRPEPVTDRKTGQYIVDRVLAMLINEALDALYLKIATREDIETAMTKGTNYPKGLLQWGEEMGCAEVLRILDGLYEEYREDRYRASPLLRRMAGGWKTEDRRPKTEEKDDV